VFILVQEWDKEQFKLKVNNEKLWFGLEDIVPDIHQAATKLLDEDLAKSTVANVACRENAQDNRETDIQDKKQTRLQRLESLVEDLLRQKETPANRTPDVSGNENRQIKYITKTDCIPEFHAGKPQHDNVPLDL
jgi:hypothetical protein